MNSCKNYYRRNLLFCVTLNVQFTMNREAIHHNVSEE